MKTIARMTRTLQHRFPEVLAVRVEADTVTTLILKLPDKKRVGFEAEGRGPKVNSQLFDGAERWLCERFRNGKATRSFLQTDC